MGRRHRIYRAQVKKALQHEGWSENEFGELTKRMSKADARRQLLRRAYSWDVINAAIKKAHDEICAEEDARVLTEIDEIIASYIAVQKIIEAVTGAP
jgi:hypothetical protein